jgi:hypothetical protein
MHLLSQKSQKIAAGECRPQIGDDTIWQAKPVYDVIKQLDCLLRCGLGKGFVFNPLGKLVDADVDLAESSKRGLERTDHIQSPACKGPRRRNRL